MSGLTLLSEIWRHRKELLLPTLLVPVLTIGFALSQQPVYNAHVLLQLDVGKARSPLLQDLDEPGHDDALQRIIRGRELLRDTSHDAGMRIDPKRIELTIINDKLIEIAYHSPQKLGLEALVDALAYNFIYELLAPERLRIEQRLAATGQQLREVRDLMNSPANVEELPRLKTQEQALFETYGTLMADLAAVNAAFDRGSPNALLWFAEPARVEDRPSWLSRIADALLGGLLAGFAGGVLLVFWQYMTPRGIRDVESLTRRTQLPVVGQIPNMGQVQVVDGKAIVSHGSTTLNPVEFTEIVRLHRSLTRSLHGTLVLTSTTAQEGTSLMATLLALKSAAAGKKTLLVDLNLKNGTVSESFGLEPKAWNYNPASKSKTTPLKDVIAANANADGLDVLPLPHDRATLEKLSQQGGARKLFDGLSSAYEHIIVDTTPLAAHNRNNADPLTLASVATRCALVVLMRRTSPGMVKAAATQLLAGGADVVGIVANNLYNPSKRTLLMNMANGLQGWSPSLAGWLRANVIKSGME